MKTAIQSVATPSRPAFVAGTAAMLALAALAFAGQAEARDNVSFSVGIGVPGVQLGVSNAYPAYSAYPAYPQPVYVQPPVVYQQPAPVYYQQPRPVYVQPRPVYVQPQVIYQQPQPIYYGRPHHRGHGGHYVQGQRYGNGYGPGYGRVAAPVYYGR